MRPFVFGFTQELRKLAGEALPDVRDPPEGETFKGKSISAGMPQKVTQRVDLRFKPEQLNADRKSVV